MDIIGIILPIFHDEKADQNAINIIQTAFPDRKIECVDGLDILLGGGGVHCITQDLYREGTQEDYLT